MWRTLLIWSIQRWSYVERSHLEFVFVGRFWGSWTSGRVEDKGSWRWTAVGRYQCIWAKTAQLGWTRLHSCVGA